MSSKLPPTDKAYFLVKYAPAFDKQFSDSFMEDFKINNVVHKMWVGLLRANVTKIYSLHIHDSHAMIRNDQDIFHL